MRILLRILVVLVLILSAVSLGLGTVVFSQREQMKARLNTLEANIRQMAREIEGEQADDLASRSKGGSQADFVFCFFYWCFVEKAKYGN